MGREFISGPPQHHITTSPKAMCAPTESMTMVINTNTIGNASSGQLLKDAMSSSCSNSVARPLTPAIHKAYSPQAISSRPLKKKRKSVHFSKSLVSEVRFRPRTEFERREELFYTREEYSMFREEYMQELEDQRGKLTSWIYFAFSAAAEFLASLEVEEKPVTSSSNTNV